MFISKLQLKNFKRFTDLTIDLSEVKVPPRLVLMIGANGSGKSCVFDAFEYRASSPFPSELESYYFKTPDRHPLVIPTFADHPEISLWDPPINEKLRRAFYGRSAVRTVPQLTRTTIGGRQDVIPQDSDRPRLYIQIDQRFENDIDILAERIVTEIFIEGKFEADELRKRYIEPINEALQRIFKTDPATSLSLLLIMPPLQGKPVEIRFRKGQSEIQYDLLSSGEKEVINILLNLFVRRESYQDTIYFIDELDVHLNTALQYDLLKEITENWLPANCQLWTASHSLGFIQYAKESAHAAILDFDQFDFDQPQTITPQPKETLEVYEVAVPKDILLKVFQGRQVFLCENKNDEYYNLLDWSDKIFVGVQDKRQVYLNIKNNPAFFGLMDRDYLTDNEIQKIRQRFPNLRILGYYAFENYLYHPNNLAELFPEFDVAAYRADLVWQKNEQRDYILTGLELARRGYSVLNDENISRDKDGVETIVTALRSDDLEDFYPYFDMKTRFNRHLLSSLKLTTSKLVKTTWFKKAIQQILQ